MCTRVFPRPSSPTPQPPRLSPLSHPPPAQATMSMPPPPPRSAPASALTRRHDSPFFTPCASQGAQRTTPLPISSGAATQQERVRGAKRRATLAGGSARRRATLAGGGASGARLGGDGCGDGRGLRSGARSGRVCKHGTEPDEECEGVVWDPCGGRESCNAKGQG